jgi:hypothetical protein
MTVHKTSIAYDPIPRWHASACKAVVCQQAVYRLRLHHRLTTCRTQFHPRAELPLLQWSWRGYLQGAPARITCDSLSSVRRNQIRSLASFVGRFTGDEDSGDPKRDLRAGGR